MLGKLFSGDGITHSAQIPLSFRLTAERALRLSPANNNEALEIWQHLSHHVRRYPHDLRAHVQRILLAQSPTLNDRLEGSLLDLFLALGNAGHMLKERVLGLCAEDINEETKQLLAGWGGENSNADQNARWINGSVLASGQRSTQHKLITQLRVESEQSYSSLQAEIQDCLEYGQIDIAQELLENEVLEGRATPELEQELLIIYQHTRNGERLAEIAGSIVTSGVELPAYWAEALDEAKNW